MIENNINLHIIGRVLIIDKTSNSIILDEFNNIHCENMSMALTSVISNSISNTNNQSFIERMSFGNGGIIINENNEILYKNSRVNSLNDSLYSETFSKEVDNTEDQNENDNITSRHIDGTNYSDIIIKCQLDMGQNALPSGQNRVVDSRDLTSDYVFNEIGLVTPAPDNKLLAHLIFHPIQKTQNRIFQVIYTLRFMIMG